MVSAAEIVLEYVCPSLGVIFGYITFSAPVRDCYRALVAGKGLKELNPVPWAFMLGNCIGWVTYGSLIQNYFVFFGNVAGIVIAMWLNLQACKMQYETFRSEAARKSIIAALQRDQMGSESMNGNGSVPEDAIAEENGATSRLERILQSVESEKLTAPVLHDLLVLFNIALWIGVISLISFSNSFPDSTKELIVGITANANLVVFYAAPLSSIWTVLRSRSAATIHIPTMLTNTANGTFWAIYGFAVVDLIIAVPNALGALLGALQIVLCLIFPRNNKPGATDVNFGNSQQETVSHVDS